MSSIKIVAPCLFGIEGIAANEFKRMGFEKVAAENGRVLLEGDENLLVRANINSRFAERILIEAGRFEANTFDELFEGTKQIPWEMYIGRSDAFPVTGKSINSALTSIPDCQSIIKKAIVERLKLKYNVSWFEETGIKYKVKFLIMKNTALLMIDTSGEGLHKRGYRRNSTEAPIKETLAAAIADTARIFPDTELYDPFCGSGTILIEAALMATKTAPGLLRNFAAEKFPMFNEKVWQEERARARDLIVRDVDFNATGYDIDENAVELTLQNAKKAGVSKYIKAYTQDIRDFEPVKRRMTLITNPPYGERLLDIKAAEELYKIMGKRFIMGDGQKYNIISSCDEFEKFYGTKADKRRKLYNGMLKCQLYMYFKKEAR